MNVSQIFNHTAYTNNGNKYNKFRGGKVIGAAGAVLYSSANIAKSIAKGSFKGSSIPLTALGLLIGTAIGTGIWTAIGAIPDAIINTSRRNKIDQAAFEKKNAEGQNINTNV